jgi:type VI secretion system protein ImpL
VGKVNSIFLLDDANRKLRTAQHQGPKSLNALPLLYLLGEAGSAKTTIVLRSGLDPELIAGSAPREGDVSPTPLLNLWFTRQVAILEAGQAIRQSASMLDRLIARTRPKAYRSTFGSSAPVRAAVVCVSAEQFLAADAPTSSLAAARAVGAQLRQISRLLGAALPVYVVVTKLDRVLHFDEYVRHLSNDEVQQILGRTLAKSDASAGVYADKVSRELGSTLDSLAFALAEFRVEMLDRETEPKNAAGIYEFPREFAKLRKNLSQYLLELCKPSQLSANPYLRGFYFTGVRALMVDQIGGAAARAPAECPPPKSARRESFRYRTCNRLAALRLSQSESRPGRRSGPFWRGSFPRPFLEIRALCRQPNRPRLPASSAEFSLPRWRSSSRICTTLLLISYLNNSGAGESSCSAPRRHYR